MNEDSYFVDTNVILYSVDRRARKKQALANSWLDYLWRTGSGRLSWQVLHEFYSNAVRKTGVPSDDARSVVKVFQHWRPSGMNEDVVQKAWQWMDTAQVSYWDGLILASAQRLGCRWLLSEDFQSDRNYNGTTVINPFHQTPPDPGRNRQ